MVVIVKPTPEERSKYLDSALERGQYSPKEKEYARIKHAPDVGPSPLADIRYKRAGEEFDKGNYLDSVIAGGKGVVSSAAGVIGDITGAIATPVVQKLGEKSKTGKTYGEDIAKQLFPIAHLAYKSTPEDVRDKGKIAVSKSLEGYSKYIDKTRRENPNLATAMDAVSVATTAIPAFKGTGVAGKIANTASNVASKTTQRVSSVAKPIAEFGKRAIDTAKKNENVASAINKVSEFAQKPEVGKAVDVGKKTLGTAKNIIKENPATSTVLAGTLATGGTPADAALNAGNSYIAERARKSGFVQGIKSKPLKNFAEGALLGQSIIPATVSPEISTIATLGGGAISSGIRSEYLQKKGRSFISSDVKSDIAQNPEEFMKNFGGANVNKSDFLKEVTGGKPISKENIVDWIEKITDQLVKQKRITGDKVKDFSNAEITQKALKEQKANLLERSRELGGRVQLGTNEHSAVIKATDDALETIGNAISEATSRRLQPGTVSVSKKMQQALDVARSIRKKVTRAKPGDLVDLNMSEIEFLMAGQKSKSYFGGKQAALQGSEAGASKVDIHDNIYNILLDLQEKSAKSTFGDDGYRAISRLNQSIRENQYLAETLQGRALTEAFGAADISERLLGRGLSYDVFYGNALNTIGNIAQWAVKKSAQKLASFVVQKNEIPRQNVDTSFAGRTQIPEFTKSIPKLPEDSGRSISPTVFVRPKPPMPDRIPDPSKVRKPETDWKAMAAEEKAKEKKRIQLFKEADKNFALKEKERIKEEKIKLKEKERIVKEKEKIKAQKVKEKAKPKAEKGKIEPFPDLFQNTKNF